MIPNVESPLERYCRAGGSLEALRRRLPPRPTVDEVAANSLTTVFTAYGEQDGNGVDLSLIREALRLDVTQRIRRADAARRGLLSLRDHVRNGRGQAHAEGRKEQ